MTITAAILLSLFQQDLDARLARAFHQPEKADPSLLTSAKSSPSFGVRYVAALVQIKDTLTHGGKHEDCYRRLAGLSTEGGPKGAADHVRALAAGFKDAVCCKECKSGKVVCATCSGKKRADIKCPICDGKGRVGAPGAVDKSQVTQKCRNCDGKQIFRDARCSSCPGTGLNDCPGCLGSPWRDRPCALKECRIGRVPCGECRAQGKVEATCATCKGRGRVGAPGAIDPTQVTQRCNDCDGKGVHKEKQPCPSCSGSAVGLGYLKCGACGTDAKRAGIAPVSAVFETEPCPCDGSCRLCFGLGVRIRPAAAPTRLLE